MRPNRASQTLTWAGLNMDTELVDELTPNSCVRTRSSAPAADSATGAVADARHLSLIRKRLNSR